MWTIENKAHTDISISRYIEKIAILTIRKFSSKLNFSPPLGIKPILLKYDCISGPIVYWPLKPDKYEIGLCVDGNFPFQIIYQLAHELCHIYIDPRINGTFIEIICQKMALDVLEEIGAPLTSRGQVAVDEYISDLRFKAETKKQLTIVSIEPQSLYDRITELENSNTLIDREYNDIIALKFKELFDPIDKYGIIKHIRNSMTPPPPQHISDLTTNPNTKINITELIKNVAKDSISLSDVIQTFIK